MERVRIGVVGIGRRGEWVWSEQNGFQEVS